MANFTWLANPTIDKGLMKGQVKCLSEDVGCDGFYVSNLLQAKESKGPLWASEKYARCFFYQMKKKAESPK